MKYYFSILLCLLAGFSPAKAQVWKSNAFPVIIQLFPPLVGELKVNGTFAEPRLNHFHAGIDLKTNERTGLPVYAAEDGYISRIKIAASGYGNALYIEHPLLGITTVYGHLEAFGSAFQQWTKTQQYLKESFELDTLLPAGFFKVNKGQIIAFSGNSGSSGGPHLHFEVRNTKTEFALNPLRFGLIIKDTKAPEVKSIKVYQIDNGFYNEQGINYEVRKNGNEYLSDKINVSPGKIALAIEAFDQQDLTPENKNGLRSIKVLKDGKLIFQWQVDTIDFSKSRYVHAMLDYAEKIQTGKDFYLTCKLPNNFYPFAYQSSLDNGIITISKGDSARMIYLLEDFAGNLTRLTCTFIALLESKSYLPTDENLFWSTKEFKIIASENTFYDKIQAHLVIDSIKISPWLSPRYTLKTPVWTPLHTPLQIQIDGSYLPTEKKGKAVIAQITPDGKRKILKTQWLGNFLTASATESATFGILLNNKLPSIRLLNYHSKHKLFKDNTIQIQIEDELSGIASYRGTIDGKWVLFSYDAKNKRLSYTIDEKCPSGEHQLSLIVTDICNNSNQLTISFKN